jgi:hypothetical protein
VLTTSFSAAVLLRLLPVFVEAIHIPLHIRAYINGTLHPVSALCVCILFLCLWGAATPMYFFYDLDVFSETWYTDDGHVWFPVAICRIVVSGLLGFLYITYMSFAARAVDHYRREKTFKGAGRTKRGSDRLEEGVELGSVGDDDHSKVKDVDGRADSKDLGAVG